MCEIILYHHWLLGGGRKQSVFYWVQHPNAPQCCPGFGIPSTSCHNLPPISPGVQKCSGTGKHRHIYHVCKIEYLNIPTQPNHSLPQDCVFINIISFKSYLYVEKIETSISLLRRQIWLIWEHYDASYLSNTWVGSSSTPGFSRSSSVASGLSFHSSSSLLICWAEIWRLLICSWSEGTLTSHDRNCRSCINGCHWLGSLFKRMQYL